MKRGGGERRKTRGEGGNTSIMHRGWTMKYRTGERRNEEETACFRRWIPITKRLQTWGEVKGGEGGASGKLGGEHAQFISHEVVSKVHVNVRTGERGWKVKRSTELRESRKYQKPLPK